MLLGLAACANEQTESIPQDIEFRGDGVLDFLRPDSTVITRIAIEIAVSDSAQARGMMDRRSMPDRGGMLFYYDETGERSFWMRNTPLSLDIIFVGEDDRIVNIAKRATPYSEARINSDGPVRHVLEVRAGFTDRYGIEPGTLIRWRRSE
ncbi:MAG: DUF192 domain-containing protein [Rhodothermales bacterium]|nr:DUF192 domain-containing protein [Rhodothermales bacterium]MBO6781240.1 DUF192 domain-containing protein [Rhodothermales bacterium]